MDIKKAELEEFFSRLEKLEADKKEIADDIKESVEAFAKNHEVEKKSVNMAFKAYKDAQKDKESFILTDLEADTLLMIVMPELATTDSEYGGDD